MLKDNATDEVYVPKEDEDFMNPRMLQYFKEKLEQQRYQLIKEMEHTVSDLQQLNQNKLIEGGDIATNDLNIAFDLRTKERARKLIKKIGLALDRIEEGTYGYCQETGEPISLKRLEARPITQFSIEAQEEHEYREKARKQMRNE